jgi:hypothetical protein
MLGLPFANPSRIFLTFECNAGFKDSRKTPTFGNSCELMAGEFPSTDVLPRNPLQPQKSANSLSSFYTFK